MAKGIPTELSPQGIGKVHMIHLYHKDDKGKWSGEPDAIIVGRLLSYGFMGDKVAILFEGDPEPTIYLKDDTHAKFWLHRNA